MDKPLLIYNATLTTWGDDARILSDHAVYIEDGTIQALGPSADLRAAYPEAESLDAAGQYLMPGNICAHTHFYGAYSRGMPIPGPEPENFPQILERLWWPLDRALDADAVRLSALVSLLDAVKHGTTTLIDHHASPNCIDGSLDLIADAVEQAGLRAVLCYEVTDRDGQAKMEAGIAENLRFMQHQRPLVAGTFGLHAGLTLSDATLQRCADALPAGEGFHIHVAEDEVDERDSLRRSGKRVVERLHDHGILGPKTIAAHCVHINEHERDLLRESDTWITHQPRSNMNNGVGAAAVDLMLGLDMRLALGNDGFSNNMWAEWKAAYLLHKIVNLDPRRANGAGIARMAVRNNARLAEEFFPGTRLGDISAGAAADLILVDYHPYTPLTADNLPWHIIFGFESSMVTGTIVNGRILMHNRQLHTLDEQAIVQEALALAPQVWERYRHNRMDTE